MDRLSEKLPELAESLAASRADLVANREACKIARADLARIGEEDNRLLHRYRELKEKFERMNEPEVAELFKSLDKARDRVRALESLDGNLDDLIQSLDLMVTPYSSWDGDPVFVLEMFGYTQK